MYRVISASYPQMDVQVLGIYDTIEDAERRVDSICFSIVDAGDDWMVEVQDEHWCSGVCKWYLVTNKDELVYKLYIVKE